MHIRTYLFNSFLVHTVILIYIFSLPIYRGSIHLKSFEGYLVYLKSEEKKKVEKPPLVHKIKKSKVKERGKVKDVKTVLKPVEVYEKEKTQLPKPEKVVASEKEAALEKKETKEEKAARKVEVKESLEPSRAEALKKDIPPPAAPSPVLPEKDTGVFPKAKLDSELVLVEEKPKEKIMHVEMPVEVKESLEPPVVEKVAEVKDEGLKTEETVEEKVAQVVEVKEPLEPSGVERALGEETSATEVKDIEVAKSEVPVTGVVAVETTPGKEVVSEESLEKETMSTKDEGEIVAEILTSEKNLTPSQEDYFLKLDGMEKQAMTEIKPEFKEELRVEEKKPPLGIPASDVLFLKDIKIKVFFKDTETPEVLLNLLKKDHPMADRWRRSEKQKEVDALDEEEKTQIAGISGVKRLFSVAKAEKGTYTFVIKNKGEKIYEADVLFLLYEGKLGERTKEFKGIGISQNAVLQFKFVLPEAVFWDDEFYFTGTIENSGSLTKFNEKTGLTWKELKDY